ncbi:MAG: enoyl-CoA hydratase-related protein, partial [Beijerinckiaceae bacterium]
MNLTAFTFDIDADGIALATWDMAGKSMNVIDETVMRELDQIIDKVAGDAAIKGCVITTGKDSFAGGADLTMLERQAKGFAKTLKEKGEEAANKELFENASTLTKLYRKLETSGKPFAAAIHGICLGGAFELALACHYRIASDDAATRVGLPEIKVGLFPGAGGTQRVARLMQTGDALQMLFKGDQIKAA